MIFCWLLSYFSFWIKDYNEIPIRCVLSNFAKWSFKGLLLRIYLKYPGKVTISDCTLYFHISNSIWTEKKMHNVLGQDIKNLLLDQCIQKRSLRMKIKTPCWQFPHSNFITGGNTCLSTRCSYKVSCIVYCIA